MESKGEQAMYEVIPSSQFNLDLYKTVVYMTDRLHAPKAAQSHLDALDTEKALIEVNPQINPLVKDDFLAQKGIRSVLVKRYYLFYTVDDEKQTVNLIRFLHSRQDWASILSNTEE
jgi:plasmid stabilization system protein ParE